MSVQAANPVAPPQLSLCVIGQATGVFQPAMEAADENALLYGVMARSRAVAMAGDFCSRNANSAVKALRRFANLVMRSHQQATFEDIEAEIGEAVNFIVHVERQPGRRAIREVLRLDGYDRQAQEFRFEMVYDCMDSPINGDLILA